MPRTNRRSTHWKLFSLLILFGWILLLAPARETAAEDGSCSPEYGYCMYTCMLNNTYVQCDSQCRPTYVLCMGGGHGGAMPLEPGPSEHDEAYDQCMLNRVEEQYMEMYNTCMDSGAPQSGCCWDVAENYPRGPQ
jgi:hypothetical protein